MKSNYTSKEEVHNRALEIRNIKFGELTQSLNVAHTKNSVGDIFEAWFGKLKDSSSEPDLGVAELKATPYKRLKNGNYSAKERLVLNIINYMDIVNENFDNSHFLYKNGVIELAFYEYIKEISRDKWFFSHVALYEMAKNPDDFKIIRDDWNTIQKCIKSGHAEDLSESMTSYLAACTKGVNAKSLRNQPFSDVRAKQRAFSLKSSYMTQILRKYILGDDKSESIISDSIELKNNSLDDILHKRFNKYVGKSTIEISDMLGIEVPKSKQANSILTTGMIGLDVKNTSKSQNRLDNISELNKASYKIKTIQFNSKGVNPQNMSFEAFKFQDLITQHWVDENDAPEADLNVMFSESKFIFAVFQSDKKGKNFFKGIKFFRMPKKDIDGPIRDVWQDTINKLKEGVQLTHKGKKNSNNFINKSDNMIIHVRPKSGQSSYVNDSNSNKLPVPAVWTNKPAGFSDDYMTTQCFFLNNDYIKKVVIDLLD